MFHMPVMLTLTIRLILGHLLGIGFRLIRQRLLLRLDSLLCLGHPTRREFVDLPKARVK